MNKTFQENINDIRAAKRGVEVREAMAESLEYVEGFASTATQKADEAAASAETAASAKTAAAASAQTAEQQAGIATQQAETATQQAEAAESSKTAADAAAKRAEQFAKETEGRVTTDPTLTVSGAPADAKAVGDRINAIKIETDKTLTLSGAAADAAAVGGIVLPRVVVQTEAGSAIVLSDGEKSVSGVAEGGSFSAALPHDGEWTVTATLGTGAATETVQAEYCRTKTLTLAYYALTVTVKAGSTVTAQCGDKTVSGTVPESGSIKLYLPIAGSWTVTATLGDETTTAAVEVTEYKDYPLELAYVKIYGVCWNYGNSSTACTRLTKASDPSGFVNVDITTEPKAAVGTGAGSSPFDSCMPWSGMEEYNVVSNAVGPKQGESGFSRSSNGDVVVRIPDFWYKIVDDASDKKRYYYIADRKETGWDKHPGSGRYVGRYHTNTSNQSRTGYSPRVNITRADARSDAAGKGTGWALYDYASWCAIGLLYLVEYANWNTQAKVGRGYCDSNSSAISSGGTDSMVYHTGRASGTDGKTAVQYRHIENPWGNVFQWVDGINFTGSIVYACTDPSKYADDTLDGYTNIGTRAASNGYISALGMSTTAPWTIYPTAVGGSETTYVPDYSWTSAGWLVLCVGGGWDGGSSAGLFYFYGDSSSNSYSFIGARHLFVP